MKIAVFHNLPVGGAKRVMFEQVKGLSKNHTVDLYTYNAQIKNSVFNPNKFVSNIYSYSFDIKNNNRLVRDFQIFFKLKKLNQVIAKDIDNGRYDIVLVYADVYMEAPYLLRFIKTKSAMYDQEMLGICYLPEYRFKADVNFFKKIYEHLFRYYLKNVDQVNTRNADLIIANSKFMKNFLKKNYNIETNFIYPAVDRNIFKKYKQNSSRKQILFVGNKGEYENWNEVKSAIKVLKKKYSDIDLKILKKKKSKFSVNNDKELAQIYSDSIATICSYSGETFGLKALESMSCETPVVALNVASYPEVIIDKETGFLVKNYKQMANKLETLVLDKRKRDKMGKQARKHASKYTWEKHTELLESMLLSLNEQN